MSPIIDIDQRRIDSMRRGSSLRFRWLSSARRAQSDHHGFSHGVGPHAKRGEHLIGAARGIADQPQNKMFGTDIGVA